MFNMFMAKNVRVGGALILAVLIFLAGRQSNSTVEHAIINTNSPQANFTDIQLPVEKLTVNTVKPFIAPANVADVNALLGENKKLKRVVNQLSISLAEMTARGRGIAVVTPISSSPAGDVAEPSAPIDILPKTDSLTPYQLKFSDFRLHFLAEGNEVNYTLSQKFLILNTTGYDEQNVATNLIRLFEIGPDDVRTQIPIAESTTIVAASVGTPHMYVKFGIQGGVGQVFDGSSSSVPSVFVATPWLKRGRNRSTENTRWAFVTPTIAVPLSSNTPTQASIGLLPLSFNLGTVTSKKKLITNLWVSPYVGLTLGVVMTTRVGGLLSVTF
jgi:hypothetical protein